MKTSKTPLALVTCILILANSIAPAIADDFLRIRPKMIRSVDRALDGGCRTLVSGGPETIQYGYVTLTLVNGRVLKKRLWGVTQFYGNCAESIQRAKESMNEYIKEFIAPVKNESSADVNYDSKTKESYKLVLDLHVDGGELIISETLTKLRR